MGKGEMAEVAQILNHAMSGKSKEKVGARVRELRRDFQKVGYAFDKSPAYFFR